MGKENTIDRRLFLKAAVSAAIHMYLPFLRPDPEAIKLNIYLSSIKGDQERLAQIVEQHDVFAGFKDFTKAQRLEDFSIYFPAYLAGDLKYQIPWPLLWIIHTAETTVSRDLNPNQGEHTGAMQISSRYKESLAEATVGWEFLTYLPNQRYADDWKELLKGALYIRNGAESIKLEDPQLSDQDAILEAVTYKYSARRFGEARVKQYLKIKTLFDYSR